MTIDVCMALDCWAVQVVMLVVCTEVLGSKELAADLHLPRWLHRALAQKALAAGALCLLVLAPLLSIRRLGRKSSVVSAVGMAAVLLWASATTATAVYAAGWRHAAHALPLWPRWQLLPRGRASWRRVVEGAGLAPVVATAFVCQPPFFEVGCGLTPA